MDKDASDTLIGMMNSYGIILSTIINRLHVNGALSRPELCDELQALTDKLEIDWRGEPTTFKFGIVRSLVAGLRDEDREALYQLPVTDGAPPDGEANDNGRA